MVTILNGDNIFQSLDNARSSAIQNTEKYGMTEKGYNKKAGSPDIT